MHVELDCAASGRVELPPDLVAGCDGAFPGSGLPARGRTLTLGWATANKITMITANQAHRDTGVGRDDYVDVFGALAAKDVCCMAQPLSKLAGAYFSADSDGPAVLLNSCLDEVTIRHTAAHELGHHVLGHATRTDERIDPYAGLTGPMPKEEKLAEAFAAWFLMPLPAVQTAIRRAGIRRPARAEDVHQVACWLGTSFAGTARHLANLRLATTQQTSEWVHAWRAKSSRIRAALCGHGIRPEGRVWMLGPPAHGASLHIVPGDTLVFTAVELPDPLPHGLAVKAYQQMSLDDRTAAVVTDGLTVPTELTVKTLGEAGSRSRSAHRPCAEASIPRGDRESS